MLKNLIRLTVAAMASAPMVANAYDICGYWTQLGASGCVDSTSVSGWACASVTVASGTTIDCLNWGGTSSGSNGGGGSGGGNNGGGNNGGGSGGTGNNGGSNTLPANDPFCQSKRNIAAQIQVTNSLGNTSACTANNTGFNPEAPENTNIQLNTHESTAWFGGRDAAYSCLVNQNCDPTLGFAEGGERTCKAVYSGTEWTDYGYMPYVIEPALANCIASVPIQQNVWDLFAALNQSNFAANKACRDVVDEAIATGCPAW
jgi:hypothetical protein